MALRFSIRARLSRPEGGSGAAAVDRAVVVPFETGEVLIGREPGAAIELPFPAVSGRHARLFHAQGGYAVEDLDSVNGTFLGGKRLSPRMPEPIAVGEVLGIAEVEVVFEGELGAGGPGPPAEGTETLARRLVHDLHVSAPPAECARLVVVGGCALGREFALPLCGRAFRLGRSESCDFVLPDDDVSREHAVFERDADGIVVRDLGSKNGVEVQGQRISGQKRLRDGDFVRVGETRLRVFDPEDRYLRQLRAADAEPKADRDRDASGVAGAAADGGAASRSPAVTSSSPSQAQAVPSGREGGPRSARLPGVATLVAALVLLVVAGLVLTLAFVP